MKILLVLTLVTPVMGGEPKMETKPIPMPDVKTCLEKAAKLLNAPEVTTLAPIVDVSCTIINTPEGTDS